MDEEKRSFDPKQFVLNFIEGMTRMQIYILAGMAVFLVVFMCFGGWFVMKGFGGGPGLSEPAYTPTNAPTVTSIVEILPTVTPTITLTPAPYEQLIPADWNQYKTDLVEIWLPKNFSAASKKTSDFTNNFFATELLMTEVSSKSSAYRMQVAVTYDLMIGDSLDAFLDGKFPHFPYQARVTDRRTVFVNSVEGRRVVIEFKNNNVDYNDMVYVFQDGSTVWYVQYIAELSEFFDNLPIFEQSIKTFRPVKY